MYFKGLKQGLFGSVFRMMCASVPEINGTGYYETLPPENIPGNIKTGNYTVKIWQHVVVPLLFLLTVSLVSFTPAQAKLMKLDFAGSITSISTSYAPPGINLGDAVSGALIFDTATPDGQPLTWMGYYSDAIKSFNLTIGEKVYSMLAPPETSEIDIINDELIWDNYYDYVLFRVAVVEQTEEIARFFQLTFAQSDVTPPTAVVSDVLAALFDLNNFATKNGFLAYLPPGASEGNNFTLTSVFLYPAAPTPNISPWLILLLD